MKIRYIGKLYNTDKMDTFLVTRRQRGYYNDLRGMVLSDGTEIHFATSKFTNFEDYAYATEKFREYAGSTQKTSGVVVIH